MAGAANAFPFGIVLRISPGYANWERVDSLQRLENQEPQEVWLQVM